MHDGTCKCGAVAISAPKAPAARFYCHCTTCQALYGTPFVDLTVTWSWNLKVADDAPTTWIRRHWFPISVRRGLCTQCDGPICGRLSWPMPGLTFVVASNWAEATPLPEPAGHIFYRSRVDEVEDGLPKAHGWLASELSVIRWAVPRLLRG